MILPLIKDKSGLAYGLWPWATRRTVARPQEVDARVRKEGNMRILGIDLAVVAKHRAILADERGRLIGGIVKFRTRRADLERVYAIARRGMAADEPLAVVLEATDIVWYPVAIYFVQRGATVYLVNPRMAADLARFYQRYARSDRLSAKVLARLPVVNPDSLYPWVQSGPDYLALQRSWTTVPLRCGKMPISSNACWSRLGCTAR